MTETIRSMSLEFARDPDSLVFLRLGEALRMRGELDAASSVALAGVDRYPELPDGRDLYARILVDMGHAPEARQVWQGLLEIEPRHLGAYKGLGFLFYSEGNIDAALDHLEIALSVDPTDESVLQALRLVRTAAADLESQPDESEVDEPAAVSDGLEAAGRGILLIDTQGRVLGGGVYRADMSNASVEVGAYVTSVSQEAERTSRMLDLGHWQWIIVEGEHGNVQITLPTAETRLMVARDRSVPTGRLALAATRANAAAKKWIEEHLR